MPRSNLRERLKRYVANLERTRTLRPPFTDGVRLVFVQAENGTLAATGHTQAVFGDGGLGPSEPYLLAGADE
jgi:hypothetical protein